MVADLVGSGRSLVVAILAFAVLIAAAMTIAIMVVTVLNALGIDASEMY